MFDSNDARTFPKQIIKRQLIHYSTLYKAK